MRVGVIKRGRKRVDVDREGARARAAEGGDDVDALSGAGEENSEHCAAEGTVASVARPLLLALAGLVALWLGVCAILFVWPPAQNGPPAHADAVVMLSGDHARLRPALDLIRNGVAPVLALSSVVQHTPRWTAARHLCAAGRYGAARVVCFDAEPYSTRGEAETVARLATEHHWRSMVVVSSTFHLTRASLLFHRCFDGHLWFVGAKAHWWELPLDWANETGKLVVQLTVQRSC